jgi:hypothetical protein
MLLTVYSLSTSPGCGVHEYVLVVSGEEMRNAYRNFNRKSEGLRLVRKTISVWKVYA